MQPNQRIDLPTIAGIALLAMPLLTMVHEIGGHAAACVAVGGTITRLGAFYVDCDSATLLAKRVVSLAGPGVDALLGLIGFALWPRLKGDLARLLGWYAWLSFAFSASGYFLFSGVSGIGDLGPGTDGGIGPLPQPMVWRAAFTLGGGVAYWLLVRAGIRGLDMMLGQGLDTRPARRAIAHGFYFTLCLAAVLASLPNPVGVFITLASAAAASFGGKAGLIPIGYSAREGPGGMPFAIARNRSLIVCGILASLAFAVVLGPTLHLT